MRCEITLTGPPLGSIGQLRKPFFPGIEIRKIVTELQEWEVFVNNGESVLRALEIEQQYQISFWDGLIINAAHSSGAEILYTEDLNDGQVFGGVWVVNPFKS